MSLNLKQQSHYIVIPGHSMGPLGAETRRHRATERTPRPLWVQGSGDGGGERGARAPPLTKGNRLVNWHGILFKPLKSLSVPICFPRCLARTQGKTAVLWFRENQGIIIQNSVFFCSHLESQEHSSFTPLHFCVGSSEVKWGFLSVFSICGYSHWKSAQVFQSLTSFAVLLNTAHCQG